MYCPECGSKTSDDKKFCVKCGTPLAGMAAYAQQSPPPEPQLPFQPPSAARPPKRKDSSKLVIGIAAVSILILSVGGYGAFKVMKKAFGSNMGKELRVMFSLSVKIQKELGFQNSVKFSISPGIEDSKRIIVLLVSSQKTEELKKAVPIITDMVKAEPALDDYDVLIINRMRGVSVGSASASFTDNIATIPLKAMKKTAPPGKPPGDVTL